MASPNYIRWYARARSYPLDTELISCPPYRDAKGVEETQPGEEKRIWDVSNQFCRFQMNNLCVQSIRRHAVESLTLCLAATSIITACEALT